MSREKLEVMAIYVSAKEKKEIEKLARVNKKSPLTLSNYLRIKCGLPPNERGAPTSISRKHESLRKILFPDPLLEPPINKSVQSKKEIRLLEENARLRNIILKINEEMFQKTVEVLEPLQEMKNIFEVISKKDWLRADDDLPDEIAEENVNDRNKMNGDEQSDSSAKTAAYVGPFQTKLNGKSIAEIADTATGAVKNAGNNEIPGEKKPAFKNDVQTKNLYAGNLFSEEEKLALEID